MELAPNPHHRQTNWPSRIGNKPNH